MSQRTATVKTILSVISDRGVNYEMNGEIPVSSVLTVDDKQRVCQILFNGFRNGDIELSTEAATKFRADAELKKYIVGLVNNWIRKAPEFNGGNTYQTKNPGSRSGSGDAKIKALKALMSTISDETTKAEIQKAIDERLSELQPKVEIDVNSLPEHLRHLVK